MSIEIIGKLRKKKSPLRDKPDNMSLSDWIKLQEKNRKETANQKLDGLMYVRDRNPDC